MQKINIKFQSTRPARGATVPFQLQAIEVDISIHAPREGRDRPAGPDPPALRYFNPRAPRGARLVNGTGYEVKKDFNPRAPRGARRSTRWRHLWAS